MTTVHEGQCGLCKHFGEHHPQEPALERIRQQREAPEDFTEECGHPAHARQHLLVTVKSGCDGFEQARARV